MNDWSVFQVSVVLRNSEFFQKPWFYKKLSTDNGFLLMKAWRLLSLSMTLLNIVTSVFLSFSSYLH